MIVKLKPYSASLLAFGGFILITIRDYFISYTKLTTYYQQLGQQQSEERVTAQLKK